MLVVGLAATFVLGCLSPARVTTEASDGLEPSSYASFALSPLVIKSEALETGSPLATRVFDVARAGIEARGLRYEATAAEADLLVRLEVDRREVMRRVVSSDPDDNSTVVKPVPQAVVVVDLIDRRVREIVWRGIGTRRIPNVLIPVVREGDDVWIDAVQRVVDQIPVD